LNEPILKGAVVKAEPAEVSSAEFFNRARARLRFEVPPGLFDPNIVAPSGDSGTDRMLEIISREQPVRPAAVLMPARSPFPAAKSTRPTHLHSMRQRARPMKRSV